MNVGICKFCGNEKELVRAHIIPVSLYPADEKGHRMHYAIDGNGKLPRSRLPNGVYDPNLVCRECEDLFNAGDDYAKRLLIDERAKGLRIQNGDTPYFEYNHVDYNNLKLFFISLLWRAHATSLQSFDKVKLGPKFEAVARDMIKTGNPGNPDDFALVMLRAAEGPLGKMGASPTPRKFPPNNVRVYEFLLFGYAAYVKVDQRPHGLSVRKAQLSPGQPFLMLEKRFEDTPFFRFAKDAVLMEEATKKRLQKRRGGQIR